MARHICLQIKRLLRTSKESSKKSKLAYSKLAIRLPESLPPQKYLLRRFRYVNIHFDQAFYFSNQLSDHWIEIHIHSVIAWMPYK